MEVTHHYLSICLLAGSNVYYLEVFMTDTDQEMAPATQHLGSPIQPGW